MSSGCVYCFFKAHQTTMPGASSLPRLSEAWYAPHSQQLPPIAAWSAFGALHVCTVWGLSLLLWIHCACISNSSRPEKPLGPLYVCTLLTRVSSFSCRAHCTYISMICTFAQCGVSPVSCGYTVHTYQLSARLCTGVSPFSCGYTAHTYQ